MKFINLIVLKYLINQKIVEVIKYLTECLYTAFMHIKYLVKNNINRNLNIFENSLSKNCDIINTETLHNFTKKEPLSFNKLR